jgi:hypothetical protein
MMNALPETIRSKLGTVISLRRLAYMHHKLGDAGQTETQQLLNAGKRWKGWMIVPTFADMAHMQMECCLLSIRVHRHPTIRK